MFIPAPQKPIRVKPRFLTLARISTHVGICLWAVCYFYQAFTGALPGDPVQALLDFTGIGALNLLLISLVVSVLSQHLKFSQLMRFRKTFGVYAAVYGLLHLSTFIAFELQFEWALVAKEIVSRPYILLGFTGLLLLLALLVTSINSIKKRMGPSWQKLHNWVYLALILVNVHFIWSTKSIDLQAIIYASLSTIVLLSKRKKIIRIFK
jgi:sulfoxide reductase heme-binding subunit YedZ